MRAGSKEAAGGDGVVGDDTAATHVTPRTTSLPCVVHRVHRPRPRSNDVHHVWPLAAGGPDVLENRVIICPTGHRNVHQLLDAYRRLLGTPPWVVRRRYSAGERRLAALGYARLTRGSL